MSTVDKRVVGENIIRRIQRRTANSTDIDGNRFASYSRGYLETRREFGLSGSPNLRFTGEMLNGLHIISVSDTRIRIGVTPGSFEARKAVWNQGGNSNIPSRPFMGMLDRQIDSVINTVLTDSPVEDAREFIAERSSLITSLFELEEFVGDPEEE